MAQIQSLIIQYSIELIHLQVESQLNYSRESKLLKTCVILTSEAVLVDVHILKLLLLIKVSYTIGCFGRLDEEMHIGYQLQIAVPCG